ncbi:LysR family transcriptional regulator [Poseidonocella sp. HB161398]|uniref:LysR family transcriptional regulator n=1 Tax=Poseidonocella sp. HB161398 TaxID=2320855 RepID=UPI001107BE01|nr:LysR family transcriptional regulator [Poseidonocella sp. HB161398]
MDIRQLRQFLAIAEEGAFSRAAARLNVAQPALSTGLRKLEEELGVALFLRGPRGVVPTEAGELLLRRARGLIGDLETAREEVRSLGRTPQGTVWLGLPGTVCGILPAPLIARCRDRYPGIRIIVAEAMSGFVHEWLLEGRIELAVLYAELRETGILSRPLLDEELVLLLPPREDAPGGLPAGPLILPSPAHGLRRMLDAALRAGGAKRAPAYEVDSYQAIKQLVAGGYGWSVLPRHAVAAEAAAGELALRPWPGAPLQRRAWLSHMSARPLSRPAQIVSDLLFETVEGLIAEGRWAGAARAQD